MLTLTICHKSILQQDDALAKVETASTAETSSSEKFVRTMPRPVRFIYALLYAIISQSQLVCFFLIVLNLMVSANILSLPLPILVFTWAMLSVPRPTKRFWVTVITYTEVSVWPDFTEQCLSLDTTGNYTKYLA